MPNKTTQEFYRVYGLNLASNRSIPALIPLYEQAPTEQTVRVNFDEGERPVSLNIEQQQVYASPGVARNGKPFFQVWKSPDTQTHLIIRYTNDSGAAQFILNDDGSDVHITWDKKILFSDILTYFLGPVLGCLLRLRGCTCLHAGVVAVGNKAIAIIGTKGAGKSTTTAALACYQNLPVLSDDIAVISKVNNQYFVQPGYPRLRLWPATIDCMPGLDSEELPRVLSITDKRYLELAVEDNANQWRFQQEALPLAAIYFLDTVKAGTDNFSLASSEGGEGLFTLAANVYPEFTLETKMRRDDFKFFGRLTNAIPVRKIYRPNSLSLLADLSQIIVDDVHTISV